MCVFAKRPAESERKPNRQAEGEGRGVQLTDSGDLRGPAQLELVLLWVANCKQTI